MHQAYDIVADTRALREPAEPDPARRAERFERLRKGYPDRREFPSYTVRIDPPDPGLAAALASMGFRLAPPG